MKALMDAAGETFILVKGTSSTTGRRFGPHSTLAGGFQSELRAALKKVSLPFEISEVQVAEDPLNSTAKGTLMAATLEM